MAVTLSVGMVSWAAADDPQVAATYVVTPLLADNGKTAYRIVISKGAAAPEAFAAEELVRYLHRITGAEFEVVEGGDSSAAGAVISLGGVVPQDVRTSLDGLGEDAFLIKTDGAHLCLAGSTPRATLYAVYTWLETLGVGFPRPGHGYLQAGMEEPLPQEETVPRNKRLLLQPIDRVEKPSFSYRAILTFPMIRDRALREIDWLAKNRLNWVHLITNTDLSIWEKQQVREVLMPAIRKRGIRVQGIGHSFYAYIHPDQYAGKHPEYFAMMDGKRAATHARGATLCVSNPAVAPLMARNMGRFLRENPEIEIIDLWNNDGLGWCECPPCRRMNGVSADSTEPYHSTTRGYMKFVNHVAGLLAEEYPDVRVNALAYGFTLHCDPQNPPAPNVVVGIAPWSRVSYMESDDYYVPITEPGPVNDYLIIAIRGWAGQTKRLYLYDYYGNRHEFFPIIDTLRKDYRTYRDLGIDMISSETYMWDEFNLWAYSRLAWDHRRPLGDIIADYCRITYRAAAEPMQRFHRTLERHKWNWPKRRGDLEPMLAQARHLAAADPTVQGKLQRMTEILAMDPKKTWPHDNPPPPLDETDGVEP